MYHNWNKNPFVTSYKTTLPALNLSLLKFLEGTFIMEGNIYSFSIFGNKSILNSGKYDVVRYDFTLYNSQNEIICTASDYF